MTLARPRALAAKLVNVVNTRGSAMPSAKHDGNGLFLALSWPRGRRAADLLAR
jgi:hypothetical protein